MHGREDLFADLDVSRTVGWFTALFPVLLDLDGAAGPGEALKSVKEQLRAIPRGGIGYGLARYVAGGPLGEALRSLPRAQVLFNYLGQFDPMEGEEAVFLPAGESTGPMRDGRQIRWHELEITGAVSGGRLWLSWSYSENRHRRATIEGLLSPNDHDRGRRAVDALIDAAFAIEDETGHIRKAD